MRKWFGLSILLCIILIVSPNVEGKNDSTGAIKVHSANGTWNSNLKLDCIGTTSAHIFIKSAVFGYLGEKGGRSCSYSVGKFARSRCNQKESCEISIVSGPFIKPENIKCTNGTKKLYVQYICLDFSSSILALSDLGKTMGGFVGPRKQESGFKSESQNLDPEEYCTNFPRYIHFTLMDLDLLSCSKQSFTIAIRSNTTGSQNHTFCNNIEDFQGNRSFGFSNFTAVSFIFQTSTQYTGKRGFLFHFVAMQCPSFSTQLPENTKVEYSLEKKDILAKVSCKKGYLPNHETVSEVTWKCGGTLCSVYGCKMWPDFRTVCEPTWSLLTGQPKNFKCVKPAVPTTSTSTTTTTTTMTPSTTEISTTVDPSSTTSSGDGALVPGVRVTNTTSGGPLVIPTEPATTPRSRRRDRGRKKGGGKGAQMVIDGARQQQKIFVVGIVGGIAGFMICLVFGIALLMICKKSRISVSVGENEPAGANNEPVHANNEPIGANNEPVGSSNEP